MAYKQYDYPFFMQVLWRVGRTFVATFLVTFALEPVWDKAAIRAALVAGLVGAGKMIRGLDQEYDTIVHKLPI